MSDLYIKMRERGGEGRGFIQSFFNYEGYKLMSCPTNFREYDNLRKNKILHVFSGSILFYVSKINHGNCFFI